MFNSSVLDVAMGLIFVYLILGLMCTTVNEWIAQLFKLRPQVLKAGIQSLLSSMPAKAGVAGRDLAKEFYSHPLVTSLSTQGGDPSYVSARTFSLAVIDILGGNVAAQPVTPLTPGSGQGSQNVPVAEALARIRTSIESLPEGDATKSLLLFLNTADNQLANFQQQIETWFEDAMDRVSGWYKKKSQVITVVVAAVIAIFANADSIEISRKLFVNPTLREKIVREAGTLKATVPTGQTTAGQTPAPDQTLPGLTTQEEAELGELTGWSAEFRTFHFMQAKHDKKTPQQIQDAKADDAFPGLSLASPVFFPWLWAIVPAHLFGWFLTAVAASLGAPFWFDTLNRFMNIRAAGTSPNEKGQDRSKV